MCRPSRALWVRDGILIMRRTENSGRLPRQIETEGVGKRARARVLEQEFEEGEIGRARDYCSTLGRHLSGLT